MDDSKQGKNAEDATHQIEYRYFKSNMFRVIHTDGAWGGVTPRGDIHMALYSERPSIPDSTFNAIGSDGAIGEEVSSKGHDGMVRELEVDLVMNLPTAKALLVWIAHKVQHIEKAINEASVEEAKKQ